MLGPWVPAAACWAVAIGCGASPEPPPETSSSAATETVAQDFGLPPLPKGHVWRAQVMRVMSPGMPVFLQHIEVRERLTEDGKFIGWEVLRLKGEPSFWQGVDLRSGDVILRVNGASIGHYGQAFKVWQSLVTAPSLVVTYDRGGQTRELRWEIHDEASDAGATPAPATSSWPKAAPAGSAPPPAAADAGSSG
ncbi:MAG: hypothetical protein HY898_04460 [Deltaproteobacteria bacterium]|nr:hypothetical protein [Deltaproteobacteria bacterium]